MELKLRLLTTASQL